MATKSWEPETQPAQPPLRNYWDEAYKGLGQEVRNGVSKVKERFDSDTTKATRKLEKKTSDDEVLRKLREIGNSSGTKGLLQRLSVRAKGEIQLLAWTPKKKLDNEDICSISAIYEACVNEPDEVFDESKKDLGSVDELLQLCRERQAIAKQKSWTFDFLGRQYVVHELWGSVVDKVDKLRPVIDVAVSASSQPPADTVWSVVKTLLQFAVQGEKEASAILPGIDTTVSTIQRCAVYDRQVRDIRVGKEKVQTLIPAFEACLISTYSRILKFLSEAGECLEKSHAGIYLHAFWGAGSIVAFESDIFEFERKLFQDSVTSSVISQNDMAKQILDLLTTQQEALADGAGHQNSARQVLTRLSDNIERNRELKNEHRLAKSREKMLAWWSSSEVGTHHEELKKSRAENTGNWIFCKEEYNLWSEADGPRLLWIRGIPGAGKTLLMNRIIDHYIYSRKEAPDINDFQLAYFYCESPNRRFSHDIFRSFIRQLADGYHPLPERMRLLYAERSRPSSLSRMVSHEEYCKLLLELIPRTTETVLVLDALDECIGDEKQSANSNKEMELVLSMFKKLLKSGLPVKLIVSSRYNSKIEAKFGHQGMIEISPDDNRDDILRVVENKVNKYNKDVKKENRRNAAAQKKTTPKPKIEKELKNKMLKVFIDKSQGKFQWASMHIQYLLGGQLRGPGQIETELGKLPQDLAEAYKRFFERIVQQSDSERKTAHRVFRWLLALKGSCETTVLIAATCQRLEEDGPNTDPDPVEGGEAYILTACQNLVISDGSIFRFSHLSVQEYAEKHERKLTQDCHYDVALVCVWIVFRYMTQEQATRDWVGHHRNHHAFSTIDTGESELYDLWQFAANKWCYHFQQVTEAQKPNIREIVLRNFAKIAPSVDSTFWLRLRAATIIETWHCYGAAPHEPQPIMMHVLQPINWVKRLRLQHRGLVFPGALVPMQAILAGILWKTRHLLHDALAGESWCQELRQEVSGLGYLTFGEQEYQWRNMMNYSDPDEYFTRPRPHRTRQFEPSTQSFTLLTGGKLGSLDNNRSPLASQLIMHLKLIDYKVQEEEFTTLLRMLSHFEEHDHGEQVQNLHTLRCIFEGMVSDNKPYERKILEELARLTLLMICAGATPGIGLSGDMQQFSKYLLREFPNASQVQYHHLVPVVERLDWSGVLIDTAGSLEQGLLEILISHSADVNAARQRGSPLISAVASGNLKNVLFLLQEGADVNSTCLKATYATALIAACAQGLVEIVKNLFLHKSVYINTTVNGGRYATALFAAADAGCIRAVRLLLKNGAKEAPRAVMGGWIRGGEVKNNAINDRALRDESIQNDCQSLVAWLILGLIRGIQDVDLNIDEEDTSQDLTDYSKEDGAESGESDTNEYIRDENNTDWNNSDEDKNDSEKDEEDEDEDEDDDTDTDDDDDDDDDKDDHEYSDKYNRNTSDEDKNSSGDDHGSNEYGDGGGLQATDTTGITNDDHDTGFDINVITSMTRQLNRAMCLDFGGTSQALIESFGFSLYEHRSALAKGFQAMLLYTDKEDWRIVKDAWADFLDLAEETEDKDISDPLVNKLATAEVRAVKAVKRRQSIYEPGPPSDDEGWD